MATKMSSNLKEEIERFKKAARATEAVQKVNRINQLVSRAAAAGRELKSQRESSK